MSRLGDFRLTIFSSVFLYSRIKRDVSRHENTLPGKVQLRSDREGPAEHQGRRQVRAGVQDR